MTKRKLFDPDFDTQLILDFVADSLSGKTVTEEQAHEAARFLLTLVDARSRGIKWNTLEKLLAVKKTVPYATVRYIPVMGDFAQRALCWMDYSGGRYEDAIELIKEQYFVEDSAAKNIYKVARRWVDRSRSLWDMIHKENPPERPAIERDR